jgi:hypothetical protein
MTISTETLLKFCGREHKRLAVPFRYRGYIVACDGACLIAIPDDGRELPEPKAEPFSPTMLDAPHPVCTEPWPPPSSETKPCDYCGGTGNGEATCCDCDGSGYCICDDGDERECTTCDGHGYKLVTPGGCTQCDGTGRPPGNHRVGTQVFDGRYTSLIRSLGDVRFAEDEDRVWFECGEAIGLLMCIMEDYR